MGLRGVVGVCGGYGAAGLPVGGCVLVCGGRPAARGRDLARRAGWRAGFGAVGRQINTLPLFGVRSR